MVILRLILFMHVFLSIKCIMHILSTEIYEVDVIGPTGTQQHNVVVTTLVTSQTRSVGSGQQECFEANNGVYWVALALLVRATITDSVTIRVLRFGPIVGRDLQLSAVDVYRKPGLHLRGVP